MKKYQKPELTILDLIVKNEIAIGGYSYKGAAPNSGGVPTTVFEVSSFNGGS